MRFLGCLGEGLTLAFESAGSVLLTGEKKDVIALSLQAAV